MFFPKTKDVAHHFHVFICHLCIFSVEVSVQIFCLLIGMFVFLLVSVGSSLNILDTSLLSDVQFASSFPVNGLSFHSLNVPFKEQKSILMKSNLFKKI